MTSYQRLKLAVAYQKQRAAEIEDILRRVDAELRVRKLKIGIGLGPGVRRDAFLTDINSGGYGNPLNLSNITCEMALAEPLESSRGTEAE